MPRFEQEENGLAIIHFNCPDTEELFRTGKSRRLPQEIQVSGLRRLRQIDAAKTLSDLRSVGGRLELHRDGRHALRVNDKYRAVFRWLTGNASEVEIFDPH